VSDKVYRRLWKGETDISSGLLALLLASYFLVAACVFYVWGIPSLDGEIVLQLYSDSATYEAAAKALGSGDELITLAGNYLGPTVILTTFDFNRSAIFLFNFAVLVLGVLTAVKYLKLSRIGVLVFVLSSPLLFFSLFGVNKEIFLLPLVVFLLCHLRGLGVRWLIFALIFSVFVRWQMTLFILMLGSFSLPFVRRLPRIWMVLGLLAAISIAYPPLSSSVLDQVEAISIEGAAEEQGTSAGGSYPRMQEIQRSYGYFLVAMPKTLQLLIGYLVRFSTDNLTDNFWNSVVIMSQCFHNFFLIIVLLARRRLKVFNEFSYLIFLFSIFFAVTPVFAPRYMLPVSFTMALWLADVYRRDRIERLRGTGAAAV
jgi:hypothetical protein